MRTVFDLSTLSWTLTGWTPFVWRQARSIESGASPAAEIAAVPATVPGSVQGALLQAGVLPDWNEGLQARECEWVENRHWIYTAALPDEWIRPGCTTTLRALGLDYSGWILLNGREITSFKGSFVPVELDLSPRLRAQGNTLQIVFDCPPRWLGQIGYTSQMREWKPRFNYGWDWTGRLVQIGIWDTLLLEVSDGEEIAALDCRAAAPSSSQTGSLHWNGTFAGERGQRVRLSLHGNEAEVRSGSYTVEELERGIEWDDLPIERWWPNGQGAQPLYRVRAELLDAAGEVLDTRAIRVGFRALEWQPCEGAPAEADPWLCVVNGRPTFLQGVNWTPIRPTFADVQEDEYRRLLQTYRDLGCNLLRVWGGAFLEREIFYDLCDELGLLVWQEFPLSSSGLDNWPPEDDDAVEEMARIAASYVWGRRRHVCLAVWCGGNELQGDRPADLSHRMLARLAEVVHELDPDRRFLPTSPSGPHFSAAVERFGGGVHWDVHGPWNAEGELDGAWRAYWEHTDALFHSEVGAPGASPAGLIRRYSGDLPVTPGTTANPLWRRTGWWIEWPEFVHAVGREPRDLEEYVAWSQARQARALAIAAAAARASFPRCGGFLVWMGHDSFPCTANTSIVDFDGALKPAAHALRTVFRGEGKAEIDPV